METFYPHDFIFGHTADSTDDPNRGELDQRKRFERLFIDDNARVVSYHKSYTLADPFCQSADSPTLRSHPRSATPVHKQFYSILPRPWTLAHATRTRLACQMHAPDIYRRPR